MWNGTMFVDLDWPLNASSLLSASAELLVFNICYFYTTSVILMIVSVSQFTTFIYDFKNGDRPPSWILIFSHFCKKKIKSARISMSKCKIWWRSDNPRPSCCVFLIFKMASVRHLGIVIADVATFGTPFQYEQILNARFVFNSPNILLKLHIDPF